MKCLGYDAQKNCYVFTKHNEIWLGIFSPRWDGARLARLGKIQQSTLDEGVLDALYATPEYPPDYTETSPTTSELMESPTATTFTEAEIVSTQDNQSPNAARTLPSAALWGVTGVGITASGAPPPDNESRLRKRASHIVSVIRTRASRQDPSPTIASSAERHRHRASM
ncbi:hypothetical protein Clacol_002940 [Clathrus columnatus]|uniref:Uncharacterized protein n=1 Tax=Clathrus columnatus TaxID=1419009 RepID=A0AAV5A829_9AGAM|nr:hypothetical protein Clacol_002940 [Clathrus columnatus]